MKSTGKPTRVVELETMTVLALFCLLLNMFLHRPATVHVAMALLVLVLFVRPVAGVLTRGWLRFSAMVGAINSRVILAAVFYLLLTPIAFMYRLCTKDPLGLRRDNSIPSFWSERLHLFTRSDLEKMW